MLETKSFEVKDNTKDIEQIVVKYSDGTEKVINRGMVLTMQADGEDTDLTMEFAKCSGQDLSVIAYGFLEMSVKMGLLDELDGGEGEEETNPDSWAPEDIMKREG